MFPCGGAIGFGIVVCGVVMVGLAVSVAAVGWWRWLVGWLSVLCVCLLSVALLVSLVLEWSLLWMGLVALLGCVMRVGGVCVRVAVVVVVVICVVVSVAVVIAVSVIVVHALAVIVPMVCAIRVFERVVGIIVVVIIVFRGYMAVCVAFCCSRCNCH